MHVLLSRSNVATDVLDPLGEVVGDRWDPEGADVLLWVIDDILNVGRVGGDVVDVRVGGTPVSDFLGSESQLSQLFLLTAGLDRLQLDLVVLDSAGVLEARAPLGLSWK
jgi:hypothetical protein